MSNRHLSRTIAMQTLYVWDFNDKKEDEKEIERIIKKNLKEFCFYGLYRSIVLGNGIASLIVSKPQIHEMILSTPIPNPPCGTVP